MTRKDVIFRLSSLPIPPYRGFKERYYPRNSRYIASRRFSCEFGHCIRSIDAIGHKINIFLNLVFTDRFSTFSLRY